MNTKLFIILYTILIKTYFFKKNFATNGLENVLYNNKLITIHFMGIQSTSKENSPKISYAYIIICDL